MLTPVSWQNASSGNYILPMEISVAVSAEYISHYFPFVIITLCSTATLLKSHPRSGCISVTAELSRKKIRVYKIISSSLTQHL